jgi:hypothetical protein
MHARQRRRKRRKGKLNWRIRKIERSPWAGNQAGGPWKLKGEGRKTEWNVIFVLLNLREGLIWKILFKTPYSASDVTNERNALSDG